MTERTKLIEPSTQMERLLYATVRIVSKRSGQDFGYGTGFLFSHRVAHDEVGLLLVTNKHVIEGCDAVDIRLHRANCEATGPSGAFWDVTITGTLGGAWIGHPDPDIDLCAFPFAGLIQPSYPTIFFKCLDSSLIPSQEALEELDAVEEIFMFGYPNGLWDSHNNYPLVRRGVTASHPAINFNGLNNIVIDAACFPGSSGSPVILHTAGPLRDKKTGDTFYDRPRTYLLGVLHSGPTTTAQGHIEVAPVPTSSSRAVSTRIMMNLGYVVKADEVINLGRHVQAVLASRA